MRTAIITILIASALVFVMKWVWRAGHSSAAQAECPDAIAAYLQEHWECTGIRYHNGIELTCINGNVLISDMIVGDGHKYTSFIYTNLRTLRQGVCDCEKPFGNACEGLE